MALEDIDNTQEDVGVLKPLYVQKSTAVTHTLIAATVGKRIVIDSLDAVAEGAVKATLLSDANELQVCYHTAEVVRFKFGKEDRLMTNTDEALKVTLGGAVAVNFRILYHLR